MFTLNEPATHSLFSQCGSRYQPRVALWGMRSHARLLKGDALTDLGTMACARFLAPYHVNAFHACNSGLDDSYLIKTPFGTLHLVMYYVRGNDVAQMIQAADEFPPEDA